MMADAIEHVISYWMIYQKFQSPALGGYAVISHWLPFLLFSVYSGVLADRFDPRRIIQLGMFCTCCARSSGACCSSRTGSKSGTRWRSFPFTESRASCGRHPPRSLSMTLSGDHLHSAVRLMAMSRVLGLLGGPAVGGAMLLAFGPSLGILLNVLIYPICR